MKKRIVISVTSDLNTDQRVLKVAKSCFENGFDVFLIGHEKSDSIPLSLPYQFRRFRLLFNRGFAFYAEFNIRLFFLLLFVRADLLLSNDTDSLPANFCASKIRRKKLVFDAHELFPEIPELVDRPFVKKIWESIENLIFPHLKHSYTVCQSIAGYYHQKYSIDMKVVRNIPYQRKPESVKAVSKTNDRKIILYQGAVNIGRGLEWVIDAMPFVNNAILMIIGDGDIKNQLITKVSEMKLENKVVFIDKMMPDELNQYTSAADIGLCLLESKGLSYYFALPNRIFDYINAGIPVLASNFPEIKAIVETFKTGILTDHYEPEHLAEVLNNMIEYPFPTGHFHELAAQFCWENEEKKLLEILRSAIG